MLVERRNDGEAPPPDRAVEAAWEDIRCRQCRRLLAKNTRSALRQDAMVELKCGSCNTLNYIVGIDSAE